MMRKFHWKNFVFLFMLTFSSLNLKAKSLTFEETVKYIQDKFECCVDDDFNGNFLSVSIEGRITFEKRTYDIFEWFPNEGEGLKFKPFSSQSSENGIVFQNHYVATFDSASDAEKVFNAFKHLKTLCTPEVDPFGN
jgi:hypothetical protein